MFLGSGWWGLLRLFLLLVAALLHGLLHYDGARTESALSSAAHTRVVSRRPRPADARECLAAQVGLIKRGDIALAATSRPWPSRRRLAVTIRIFEGDFEYALMLLSWRAAHTADWDIIMLFSDASADANLRAWLAARDAGALSAAYTAVFLHDWFVPTYRTDYRGQVNLPDKTITYAAGLKTVLAWVVAHPCFDAILQMDADALVLRPETLAAAVEAKLAHGLVFSSAVRTRDAFPIVIGCWWGLTSPLGDAHVGAFLANVSQDALLTSHFSDMLAFDSRDAAAFLRDIGQPRSVNWDFHYHIDSIYEYWKMLVGHWVSAPGMVHAGENDNSVLSGTVFFMERGDDWEAFRNAYGSAPSWAALKLCRNAPHVCLDGANGIHVVYNVDLMKHDTSWIKRYYACEKELGKTSAVEWGGLTVLDVFKCTLA